MKICLLGTAYPLRGGIAHYIALLYSHLSKDHDVEVVTFTRQYPAFLFPGKSQEETGDLGLTIHSRQLMDSVNPFNWVRIGLMLRKERFDLIIYKYWLPFFGPCFGTICRFLRWRTKTQVLAICDNVVPHERRPADALFTAYAFGATDGFIVQSNQVMRELFSVVPNARYRKIPHPVYEIFGSLTGKQQARERLGLKAHRIVLFFGYVRPYKGLHVLIEAMKLVDPALEVHALVAGEFYEDDRPYLEQIRSLGLEHRIHLRSDYIPNHEVASYFSAADVVVLSYTSATQSGIVQIAYNFNKPVIATPVGGLPEVVAHNESGLLVDSTSPSDLAKGIERFYREGLEEKLSRGASQEKKKYSWQAMTAGIESLVEELNNLPPR